MDAREHDPPQRIGNLNRETYSDPAVVRYYESSSTLQAAERVIFEGLAPFLADRDILDIGVGGGRTASYLSGVGGRYLGIDFSPEMIASSRRRHPGVTFRVEDARDLSAYEAKSHHLVVFSFNGIDYVDHVDRLRILAEIRRVLAPDGHFVFSSHNLAAFRPPAFPWTWHPLKLGIRALRALPASANRLRHRRYEQRGEGFAILNDGAHENRLLTYYIALDQQVKQLRDIGFDGPVVVYDASGTPVVRDDTSPWLYYHVQPRR